METLTNYEDKLKDYMERYLHPETARNIGHLVATSELLSAETAMAVIIEMQVDHARRDAELASQVQEQISRQNRLFRVDL